MIGISVQFWKQFQPELNYWQGAV